jgi:hypothetical protein
MLLHKKRTYCTGWVVALMAIANMFLTGAAFAHDVVLQDSNTRIVFDSKSGALTSLEDKGDNWVVERRAALGNSFRLFAPLHERRWNPVYGQKQQAVEVKKISDQQVHLEWKNLLSEDGGTLPLTLIADVTLTNGTLTFHATLENDSDLTVETIDYPYLGDFNSPTRASPLELRVMTNNVPAHLRMTPIYPEFMNEKGYWGVFWPLKTREAQPSRFCLISAPDKGLSVEMADARVPYQTEYTFEQHPGVISQINFKVPQEDEIAGTPVHLEFRICHFVFATPHSTRKLDPVVFRFYKGDWQSGVALSTQ